MASPTRLISNSTPARPATKQISKRLALSYVLDWFIIVVVAAAGGVLNKISGNHHAFNINDPAISYPLLPNTVSITIVGIIAFVVPGVVIALLSLLLSPIHPAARKHTATSLVWRSKLWEWHAGWLGLGLSLAATFFVTSGLKDVVGKPRPDLLARCDPDLLNIQKHAVGGLGLFFEEAPILVDTGICKQTNQAVLDDGFAAFPSGHSSIAWAGLLYFSLWLCAKFAIAIPYLLPAAPPPAERASADRVGPADGPVPRRYRAAAPPLPLLVVALAPICTALYVNATRWADDRHNGWDILAGSLIGIVAAWGAFRWYHLPIRRGEGWSWGPRSRDRAFATRAGSDGFVGAEGYVSKRYSRERDQYEDLELGTMSGARQNS